MPLLIALLILAVCDLLYQRRVYARQSVRDRILAVLDALYASAESFPYYDVKPYVLSCLEEYDGKNSNTLQHKYTRQDGCTFSASPSTPVFFVFVCLGMYAVDYDDCNLRAYCDAHILDASRAGRSCW